MGAALHIPWLGTGQYQHCRRHMRHLVTCVAKLAGQVGTARPGTLQTSLTHVIQKASPFLSHTDMMPVRPTSLPRSEPEGKRELKSRQPK